jgi:hypothetical protein
MIFYHNSQPRAMVIGRLERHAIPLRVGYKTIMKPKLRSMTVVYGGVLGQPDEGTSALLVRELMSLLQQGQADLIFFNHLRVDSAFYRQVRKMPTLPCRDQFPVIEPHWRMLIPKNMEEFFASLSKNTRSNLKSHLNKLGKKYPGKVRIHTYSKLEDVPQAIRDVTYISKNTYQHALGAGFADTLQNHILLNTAATKGWFRVHILYINEEPTAFEYALKYGRTYFGEATGYDSKWKDLNVGTVTLLKVLEILCQEGATDYFDFGFGDAPYKQQYCNEHWMEASVYIFAPRPYPILINTLQTIMLALDSGLKYIVNRVGMLNWIKRCWRSLLQQSTAKQIINPGGKPKSSL